MDDSPESCGIYMSAECRRRVSFGANKKLLAIATSCFSQMLACPPRLSPQTQKRILKHPLDLCRWKPGLYYLRELSWWVSWKRSSEFSIIPRSRLRSQAIYRLKMCHLISSNYFDPNKAIEFSLAMLNVALSKRNHKRPGDTQNDPHCAPECYRFF